MEPDRIVALIDSLASGLRLFARQWTGSPEDVVQDAFVALTTLADEPREPTAWLYRAVRNGAINAGIAERRRKRRETVAGSQTPRWFEADTTAPDINGIDPAAAQAALADLPDPQREVIVAHLWGGLTFDQIATLTGTSSSTAHRLYRAGLQTLRNHLEAPCHPPTAPTKST